MTIELKKQFSYAEALSLVVIMVVLMVTAMFFADEDMDLFDDDGPRITQTMELRGKWLGINLASMESPTARRWGLPPNVSGVMVVELAEKKGWRARQAGLMQGDVIVAADGNEIRDMADLFEISRNLNVGSAVVLDIRRWGQPMKLVLPALYRPVPVPDQQQFVQGRPPVVPGNRLAQGQIPRPVNPGQPVAMIPGTMNQPFVNQQLYYPYPSNNVVR